jgi:hypothetical protein
MHLPPARQLHTAGLLVANASSARSPAAYCRSSRTHVLPHRQHDNDHPLVGFASSELASSLAPYIVVNAGGHHQWALCNTSLHIIPEPSSLEVAVSKLRKRIAHAFLSVKHEHVFIYS